MSRDRFARPFPTDLCPEHKRIYTAWRDHHYDPTRPKEWGGGHILDSRTTHAERAADWDSKNLGQMILTEETCRSGKSPQCGAAKAARG